MNDRRRFSRIFFILLVFGIVALTNVLGRPTLGTTRAVDIVQLIGAGMCFGAAIMALAMFLRSPRAA
jgi:hypothetical protein